VGKPRWSWWIAGLAAVGAAILVACSGMVTDHEMQAMTFFGSGMLLLTAFLAAVSGWMRSTRHSVMVGQGWWSIARLGIRNAARHPARSLLTAGLLASAAFLIVAVEAFRRQADPRETASANGGFSLLAESDLPLIRDLNSADGRREVAEKLVIAFRDELHGDNAKAEARLKQAQTLLDQVKIVALRLRKGDDASCLSLYQPRRPRLLGVPAVLIDQGGFLFDSSTADTDTERKNPWLILRRSGSPYPVFGEKNTVTYVLNNKLGGTLEVPDAAGIDKTLRIEGLLQDSVFQSSLLLSEESFLQLYPGHEGYNFFLIQSPPGQEAEVKRLLETALADRGFEVTPSTERLESYLAVENTYLSTFQALGGLGLLLGSLGLAVVLVRSVWERRAELALLRALGFRRTTLGWLVLAENAFLLLVGLGTGTVSALVAVAPHLSGRLPWGNLVALLGLVTVVGLLAGAVAVASTLRAPLIPALRRE
jgi:hypothetical protein